MRFDSDIGFQGVAGCGADEGAGGSDALCDVRCERGEWKALYSFLAQREGELPAALFGFFRRLEGFVFENVSALEAEELIRPVSSL